MKPIQALPPAAAKLEERTNNDEDQLWRLAAIPGLDLEVGLAVTRGNVAKYMQLVVLFVNSNQSHVDQISALAAAENYAAIESIAHSLKGSSGMLGAVSLAEAARLVLSAVRGRAGADKIPLLCANLGVALSTLIDGIRLAMAGSLEPVATEVDSARLEKVLVRLEDLLRQGDIAAGNLARKEASLLRHAFGNAAEPLLLLIDSFDFAKAAAKLHEYRSGASSASNHAG